MQNAYDECHMRRMFPIFLDNDSRVKYLLIIITVHGGIGGI